MSQRTIQWIDSSEEGRTGAVLETVAEDNDANGERLNRRTVDRLLMRLHPLILNESKEAKIPLLGYFHADQAEEWPSFGNVKLRKGKVIEIQEGEESYRYTVVDVNLQCSDPTCYHYLIHVIETDQTAPIDLGYSEISADGWYCDPEILRRVIGGENPLEDSDSISKEF